MMRKKLQSGVWVAALAGVLIMGMALTFSGCGGCQKEPPPAPKPAPVEKPAMPAPPAAPKAEPAAAPAAALTPGAVAPVTLSVLKLMPESSVVSLALPPITGLYDKAMALAKRLAPPDVNIQEQVEKQIQDLAQDAEVPSAKTLGDLAKGKGINAEAPMAVFVDLSGTAASAKGALAKLKEEMDAQKAAAPKEPAPAEKKEGAPPAEKKEGAPPAEAAKPAAPPAPKPPDLEKVVKALKIPAVACVVNCSNPPLAEETMKEIVDLGNGYVDPAKVESVDVNGVAVHCYDPEKLAYALVGDKLIASNSLALLKEVLARVAAPAAVRYGSTECPAEVPDEAVLVMRADKLMPMVKELLPTLLSMNPAMMGMATAQMDQMTKSLDAFAGDDPMVTTLGWTDKKVELLTRVDMAKHPAMKELIGDATPLRLAALLPETTLMMLSLRFNDKMKENFKSGWLNALPPEVQKSAGFSNAMMYINQIVTMIGDELTIGVAGAAGGLPQVFVMAGLAKPAETKTLIQTLAPMTPSETYAGTDISMLALPAPIPFYIAFPGDTIMLSNDIEKLKGVIDLLQAKSTSKLFASMDPVLDANTPRYGLLLIKSGLVSDVVLPLANLAGGIPAEVQAPLGKVVDVVREVRASRDLVGNWLQGRMTIYIK